MRPVQNPKPPQPRGLVGFMGFFLEVSILKGEIMSFYIQGIDQKSSQNLSKTFQKSFENRGLEAS